MESLEILMNSVVGDPEPKFDFAMPEDVWVWIGDPEADPSDRELIVSQISQSPDADGYVDASKFEIMGAASYEEGYGGFLDDRLRDLITMPDKAGCYVVQGITAVYLRGDGYTTDDDMDFYYEGLRPATPEETEAILKDVFGDDHSDDYEAA